MSKNKVKLDPKNFREHPEENQKLINKSLSELGAGRSILLDKDFFTIAGNGVLAEAEKLGIKVKVIDSDGSELIAIRRTDIGNRSKKRKQLALVDNSTTDLSRWNWSNIKDSWGENELQDWGGLEVPAAWKDDYYSSQNKEIDIDTIEDKIILKLSFTFQQYAKVKEKLLDIDENLEKAVLKVLKI